MDHLPDVVLALLLVAVEQARAGLAAEHGGQLPGQVVRVPDAAVHPLPGERRRQVRGAADKVDAAKRPARRDPRVEAVDDLAPERRVRVGAMGAQQPLDHGRGQQVVVLLAPHLFEDVLTSLHKEIAPARPSRGSGHPTTLNCRAELSRRNDTQPARPAYPDDRAQRARGVAKGSRPRPAVARGNGGVPLRGRRRQQPPCPDPAGPEGPDGIVQGAP